MWKTTQLFVILFISVFIFTGCKSTKKQTQLKELQKINEVLTVNTATQSSAIIDNTRHSDIETNITKVDFFNPNEIQNFDSILQLMRDVGNNFVGIPKSITTTNNKAKETQKGKVVQNSVVTVDSTKKINSQIKKSETTKTETLSFWDKYKWSITFSIIIITCSGVFIVRKKYFKSPFGL